MKNFYTINPKRCRGRLCTRGGRFRTFPFSDTRWSFTRASNYRALTGKNLVFWIGSGLWQVLAWIGSGLWQVLAYGRWSHMEP